MTFSRGLVLLCYILHRVRITRFPFGKPPLKIGYRFELPENTQKPCIGFAFPGPWFLQGFHSEILVRKMAFRNLACKLTSLLMSSLGMILIDLEPVLLPASTDLDYQ